MPNIEAVRVMPGAMLLPLASAAPVATALLINDTIGSVEDEVEVEVVLDELELFAAATWDCRKFGVRRRSLLLGIDRWLAGTSVRNRSRECHCRWRNEPEAADRRRVATSASAVIYSSGGSPGNWPIPSVSAVPTRRPARWRSA